MQHADYKEVLFFCGVGAALGPRVFMAVFGLCGAGYGCWL